MNRSNSTKWLRNMAVALAAAALTTSSAFSAALARYSNPYYSFFNPGPGGLLERSDNPNLEKQIEENYNLTRFSEALQRAGMSGLLSQKNTFTVLAPVNEAFAMLPAGAWETLLKPENKEILRRVVSYHIVPGKVTNEALDAGNIFTMAGESVKFQVIQGSAMLNEAKLIGKEPIPATNGSIVLIDKVLIPADVAARLALGAFSSSTTPSKPTTVIQTYQTVPNRVRFECHISPMNIPTTYAITASGPKPIIRWTSEYFSGSGYTPEVRCQQVAARFQNFYNSGMLKYLASGYVNNQPVICVAQTQYSGCHANTVLFTLKPGSDANERLRKLLNLRAGSAYAADILYESSSDDSVYVDFEKYLNASIVENIGSASNYPSPNITPEIEAPAPSGGDGW